MEFIFYILGILLTSALVFARLRDQFKIAYYETKLKNRGVDISRVKNMPWYKMWLN